MHEFYLLGRFQVKQDGRGLDLPSRPAQALLAYLLLNSSRPVRREKLAGLLWPEADEANARSNLRHALWRIRKALEVDGRPVYIDADDLGVTFRLQPGDWLDVAVLESPLSEPAQLDELVRTVQACGGELLPGFYDDWVVLERIRLQAVYEDRLQRLAVELLRLERWSEAAAWCEKWIAMGGAPEPAYRLLMLACAGQTNQAGVTATYQRCREALRQELGVEPGEQTEALYRELVHGRSEREALARFAPPPIASWQPVHKPLPATRTSPVSPQATSEPETLLERITRGQFVERQKELAEALRLWTLAAGGEGQVLLISGEPGVGKTRFVRELMGRVQISGATLLTGECFAEGSAPYAPLAQLIAVAGLEGTPHAMAADLLTIAPALRSACPDIPPNPFLEPQAERQRIFDNVTGFFARLAGQGPLLLFIDDVHWADSGSLFLLHQLARRARSLRLLIVLAYRELELSEARALYELLQELNRERLATWLALKRFDREQTRAQLATLFQDMITPEFLDGIFHETDGNPFFVEEVCKALVEAGKIYQAGGRWRRLEMNEIEIPQSVRVTIELRLGRLPTEVQEMLRAAAVLGREFEFDVLQAMDGRGDEALIEALEAAERAQLITEARRRGAMAFAFTHGLIALALHEGLNALRRQRLHRRAAQAIERVHAGELASGDYAAALGRHYTEGGKPDKAATAYLQAAERARSVYAYQEALAHYRQALANLKALGAAGMARAARTTMTLGQLYHTVFDFERSQQTFREGFKLWGQVETEQRRQAPPLARQPLRLMWRRISTLDLTATDHADDLDIINTLFPGLVEITPDLDLAPGLAHSWEVLEDGCRYVFHLRSGVRWSDGQPLTAHDFEFTWKYRMDPARRVSYNGMFFMIKNYRACYEGRVSADQVGIQVIDDLTLVIELEEPASYFLHMLAFMASFAIPAHVVRAKAAEWAAPGNIVTCGAFDLESWQPGERLVLRRNPDYYGRRSGNLERVDLSLSVPFSISPVEQLADYRADIRDVCEVRPETLELARQLPGEYIAQTAATTVRAMFRTDKPPFDDVRVRQAFAHAIDRRGIVNTLYKEFYEPALGGFVPPAIPGHSPGIGLPYAPEQARQLLAEAGFPGGQGFPKIKAYYAIYTDSMGEFLQQQLRAVLGVDFTIENSFARQLPPDWDLQVSAWTADFPDPHSMLYLSVPSDWSSEYRRLLDAAGRTTDPLERLKIYQAADHLLVQEAVVAPMIYGRWHWLIKPWIRQYPTSALRDTFWKDVVMADR